MMTPEQKLCLKTVLKDYEMALLFGEDEEAENAAVALDATLGKMTEDPGFLEYEDNAALMALINRSLADNRRLTDAATIVRAALLFLTAIEEG